MLSSTSCDGGCQWRLLPKDFPPHQTVYDYFRSWRFLGAWAGYTTDCAAMCGKHMAAIGSRALESSTQGFQVLQWRWIVERTFGWLNRSRRLSKDFEALPETTEAWIRIAMIQLMIRRLAAKK